MAAFIESPDPYPIFGQMGNVNFTKLKKPFVLGYKASGQQVISSRVLSGYNHKDITLNPCHKQDLIDRN